MPERNIHEKYLLGLLSEQKQAGLEERYFAEESLFESLEAAETDLLDEYVRGELDSSERQAFEGLLEVSPSLRRRLPSAAAWIESPEPARTPGSLPSPSERNRRIWLAAAAAILFAALGGWLLIDRMQIRRQMAGLAQQRDRLEEENRRLTTDLAMNRLERRSNTPADRRTGREPTPSFPTAGPLQAVSFTLMAGLPRGVGISNDFVAPRDAQVVVLQLPVSSETGSVYRARIEDDSGRTILDQQRIDPTSSGGASLVTVAATRDILKPGDYLIELSRLRSGKSVWVGSFAFRLSYE